MLAGFAASPCDINEGFVLHSRGSRNDGFVLTDSESADGTQLVSLARFDAFMRAINTNCQVRFVINMEIAKEASAKANTNITHAIIQPWIPTNNSATCLHDGGVAWPAGVPFCAQCGSSAGARLSPEEADFMRENQ